MKKFVYLQTVKSVRDSLPADRRDSFDLQFAAREKDPVTALVLSLFLGAFGIDRFYVGNVLLGILKLITFGALGIWTVIDWFLIMGATRRRDVEIANEIKMMMA